MERPDYIKCLVRAAEKQKEGFGGWRCYKHVTPDGVWTDPAPLKRAAIEWPPVPQQTIGVSLRRGLQTCLSGYRARVLGRRLWNASFVRSPGFSRSDVPQFLDLEKEPALEKVTALGRLKPGLRTKERKRALLILPPGTGL